MHCTNIIGGWDYEHMSRITYKDADYANNSRSTDHHHDAMYLPMEGAQSTRPFANCSMDFITDLPPIDSFDSILVMVDQGLTKGVI